MSGWGAIAIHLVCAAAWAQEIPNTRVMSCTEGGCHAPVMDHKVLHGPTALSACDACHQYDDPAEHTFILKHEGAQLCTFCHIGAATQFGVVGHEPFDKGECVSCHNPHGGSTTDFLNADSQAGLCAQCHDEVILGSHIHSPAADGECLACHGAHGAEHEGLLMRTGSALCLTCHEDTKDLLGSASRIHEPAADNCLECHEPHASDLSAHLRMEPLALCESCHPEPGEIARHSAFTHSIVIEGRACMNCHDPHASNHEGMLHSDPIEACLVCHNEPIALESGRVIAGVPEIAAEGAVLHGPVRKELCTGCHDLHGSEHEFLLSANYTPRFYESFKLEHYELCFECHSKQLVLVAETTDETNFRNGSQNLHHAHVNMEEKGRACRSCHATHASGNEVHVVDSVPYGNWEFPLVFERTETGGSCGAACHHESTYDRVNPTPGIIEPEGIDGGAPD